jgi:hypothetical protein
LRKEGNSLEIRAWASQHELPGGVPLRRPSPENTRMNKKIFSLLLLPTLLAGCGSVITNLTPSSYVRDPSGNYRVEAEWASQREAIREGSFRPMVVVETNTYPMRAVPLVQDRWEGFIPVAADQDLIHFYYKFDFMINSVSEPRPDSLLSPEYSLKIVPSK